MVDVTSPSPSLGSCEAEIFVGILEKFVHLVETVALGGDFVGNPSPPSKII